MRHMYIPVIFMVEPSLSMVLSPVLEILMLVLYHLAGDMSIGNLKFIFNFSVERELGNNR